MKLLPIVFPLFAALAQAESIRLAAEARVWIKVPADAPPLESIASSRGAVAQAPWESDPAVRARHSDISFPIHWWTWTDATISFTPAHDGEVELLLTGPWAAPVDGKNPRQEVVWDDLAARGAVLENGGFETTAGTTPAGWTSPWGGYPAAGVWPLANHQPRTGGGIAASWMDRPLQQTIRVTKGERVELTLHAMAATPPDFVPPRSLGNDTPAHGAGARLKRGMNLGNGWEAPPGQGWGVTFTTRDIDHIADEGFDHIRVPVAWHHRLSNKEGGVAIDPEFLAEIEPVLRRALDRKLHVMINWHHYEDLVRDPAAHREAFIAGWEAIAGRFKDWPAGLFFELLNEPHEPLAGETLNSLYQETIRAIRGVDPRRILVASPSQWGSARELDRLRLPDGDDRILVTIHCYDPFHFTHQGANWVGLQELGGVIYPGPPANPLAMPAALAENEGLRGFLDGYNRLPAAENPSGARQIRETLDLARAWSDRFGRPLHLGEFGAHNPADHASRARYLSDVRRLTEERAIPWALWEWKAGFGYWDAATGKPRFREALMK